jgi:hypothetical protein
VCFVLVKQHPKLAATLTADWMIILMRQTQQLLLVVVLVVLLLDIPRLGVFTCRPKLIDNGGQICSAVTADQSPTAGTAQGCAKAIGGERAM